MAGSMRGPKHTYGGGCENRLVPSSDSGSKNMSFPGGKGGTDPKMESKGGGSVQSVPGMDNYAGKNGLHGMKKYGG